MLVISDNLRGIAATGLAPLELVEEFSVRVRLDHFVRRMKVAPETNPLIYGTPYQVSNYFEDESDAGRDLTLAPGECALACSVDSYAMPDSYFGLVQTKGSLARLFVSATCNDGQVEPGYRGKITLELTNHATFPVTLPTGTTVAQLFVLRCSTSARHPYDGRYQDADRPTLAFFDASPQGGITR